MLNSKKTNILLAMAGAAVLMASSPVLAQTPAEPTPAAAPAAPVAPATITIPEAPAGFKRVKVLKTKHFTRRGVRVRSVKSIQYKFVPVA